MLGTMGFFSDQSYMQGLGDMIDLVSGDPQAASAAISNAGRQLVPMTSLLGWITRLIDPVFRDPKGNFVKDIQSGIPIMSYGVDPYLDPLGQPSKRQRRLLNSISPAEFSPENPMFEELWQVKIKTKQINNIKTQLEGGSIDQEEAIDAMNRIVSDFNGDKLPKAGVMDILASPVMADEQEREVYSMLFQWNSKSGLYEDQYGNAGPDQPDHNTVGDTYVYDFTLNPQTGHYEDQEGNPAPLEITIDSENPEQSLESLLELGKQIESGKVEPGTLDKLRLKVSSSSSVKGGGKVPSFKPNDFTPKNTALPKIKLAGGKNTVSQSSGNLRVSQFRAQLPSGPLKTRGLIRAR